MDWKERDGVRWLEAALPGARGCFSTRIVGVSEGAFESLNLGVLTDDETAGVHLNRERLAAALGITTSDVLAGHQVHGNEVTLRESAPEPNAFATSGISLSDADGQATPTAGLAPLVFVADCLPVLMAGPDGVAAVHCGWRGLAGGIIERGARIVGATAAAVGPGIGRCCYEVGEEVLAEFSDLGEGIAEGRMLDLAEVARRQLLASGVEQIELAGLCTSCNPELFFSHRRDHGRTGRQAGIVFRPA